PASRPARNAAMAWFQSPASTYQLPWPTRETRAAVPMVSYCMEISLFAARPEGEWSERVAPAFAGTDANGLLHRRDEDLAIADLAGVRGLDDGVDDRLAALGRHHDVHADLGQEIHHVLGAAVKFGMPLLAAETLDLGDGQPVDVQFGQGFADFVQLERLDDGGDL